MAEEEKKKDVSGPLVAAGAILILVGFALYFAYANVQIVNAALTLAIGILGALSLLVFLGGFVLYQVRMGQEYRIDGVVVMEWGVALIFFVVLLAGLLQLLERLA